MSTKNPTGLESVGTTQDETISGPHLGLDKYGNPDHHYYACERCGAEWDTTFGRDHDCEGSQ